MKKMYKKAIVRYVPNLDDLYIDIPGAGFKQMGWNENTKLLWSVNDNGHIVLSKPKHDTEPGLPVDFAYFLESDHKNDSSN